MRVLADSPVLRMWRWPCATDRTDRPQNPMMRVTNPELMARRAKAKDEDETTRDVSGFG